MPRVRTNIELSLLPFLSILCGLIAVLMLYMILILNTRVIETKTVAAAPPPTPPRPGVENGIDEENHRRLTEELDRLTGLVQIRRKEAQDVVRRIEELRELVRTKEDERLAHAVAAGRRGVELGAAIPVRMTLAGDQRFDKKPILIEVKAEGYVVHPEAVLYPPIPEPKSPRAPRVVDRGLRAALDRVLKKHDHEYLLFLIHPNGIENFRTIRALWNEDYKDVNIGFEPFSPEWLVLAR